MSKPVSAPPIEVPCGSDCAFFVPLKDGAWDAWGWCTHPARGGLIRTARDCRWYRNRPDKPGLPAVPAGG